VKFLKYFFIFVSLNCYAGISTNGGNITTDQDNVWYLGDKPINYCIERSPAFSLNTNESRELVRESINDWLRFFQKYGLDQMEFNSLKDGMSLKLSLQFNELDKCNDDPELLRFELGASDSDVRRALALDNQVNALALAIRQDYNHETYRNGGRIWIRNAYLEKEQIKHLVLHELGHIFGMAHDSVFVMDTEVADNIRTKTHQQFFGKIESPGWVYDLNSGDEINITAGGRVGKEAEPNFILLGFTDIFSFNRKNSHEARLKVDRGSSPFPMWDAKLTFREVESNRTIEMKGKLLFSEAYHDNIRGNKGPVLYTDWHCSTCKSGSHYRRQLDPRPIGIESSGRFIYNGVAYPAILENRKGLLLRVFITSSTLWWTTQKYFSSTASMK